MSSCAPCHPVILSILCHETVILFEDEGYRPFLPLVILRPVFDLRCGIFTLRERLAALLGRAPAAICRAHLASVYGGGRWPLGLLSASQPLTFVNGRALDLDWLPGLLDAPDQHRAGGRRRARAARRRQCCLARAFRPRWPARCCWICWSSNPPPRWPSCAASRAWSRLMRGCWHSRGISSPRMASRSCATCRC